MTDISVRELKGKLEGGDDFVLLDVREPNEIETAAIGGATFIRMSDIPERYGELPLDKDIVVMCHHGGRSERVTRFLNANGYDRAVNLAGGIDDWAQRVDTSIPRY